MRKTSACGRMTALLIAAFFCMLALAAGVFSLSREAEGAALDYAVQNVIAKSADEKVSLFAFDAAAENKMGEEISLAAGPHGGSPDKSILTDGTVMSTSSIRLADTEGKGVLGWVVIDAGKSYPVNRVLVDLVHDWGAGDLVIQLSMDAEFTSPVTVFNNDNDGSLGLGDIFTADADITCKDSVLMNVQNAGRTFEFAPVEARYIRVTGNTYGNSVLQGYTALGEIQMFAVDYSDTPQTHAEVSPAVFSTPGGVYMQAPAVELSSLTDGATIYYTTDGSCPTKESPVYSAPIDTSLLSNACVIRAVCEVNGILGIPVQNSFAVEESAADSNVAYGKTPYAKSLDMSTDLSFGKDASQITDGMFSTEYITLKDADDKDAIGWTILDFGAVYDIVSVQVSFWHDNHFTYAAIQLSETADFSDAYTVYSNNAEIAPVTTDETEWSNTNANGRTISLESPVAARYIRVTGRRREDNSKYCCINEIKADKAVKTVDPAPELQDYVVSAADNYGLPLQNVSVANGSYFKEVAALLPGTVQLTSSQGKMFEAAGSWECAEFSKDETDGETEEGVYTFVFAYEAAGSVPADLYSVVSVSVTVEKPADIADLQAKVAEAEQIQAAKYTVSTFAALQEKIGDAEELLSARTKTQAQADAALAALESAQAALVERGDVSALTELYNSLAGKKETDYTVSSWKVFSEAYAAAGNLLQKADDVSQAQADGAKAALETAVLAERGDIQELSAKYDELKNEYGTAAESGTYTKASWTDYLQAMEYAAAAVNDNSDVSQAEADALLEALGETAGALIEKADVSVILERAAQYRADKKKYTAASWAEFDPILLETEEALGGEDVSKEDYTAIVEKFEAAEAKLVTAGDPAALAALIDTEVGDASQYTATSRFAYETALAQAAAVANGQYAQEEIDAAREALQAAIDGLEKAGDKTQLTALVGQAKQEAAVGQALADAINAAQEVLNDADASEEDVNAAYAALNEALENNEGGSSGDAGGCGGFAGVSVLAAAIICLAAAVVLLAKKKAGR